MAVATMKRRFWVRGRRNWNASPAREFIRDDWSRGVTLVVHHTAGIAPRTEQLEHEEMRSIQRAHMARGWDDIGYNYVIMPSGRVYEGRGYNIIGAHTLNHNTGTIGVSFAGNYEISRPSRAQIRAYRKLVKLLKRNGADIRRARGHKQMPDQATACPGKYLMHALKL